MSNPSRVQTLYQLWLQDPLIDAATKSELMGLSDRPEELEDRFYRELEFGTGGMRGVIGAGTNRMNVYTIGRATQGLAQFLLQDNTKAHSVVIAYDSRRQSPEFALETALVLAGNGITAYVFESLRPTPELSFAVRELDASAGIVVTASHNPPEYNGYKVYGSDGGQMVSLQAEQVIEQIRTVHSFSAVNKMSRKDAEPRKFLRWIGEDIDQAYVKAVTSASPNPDVAREHGRNVKIVYTPLHGAGNLTVRRVLKESGFEQVYVVPGQEKPDPNFSTVKSPNPEEREAFTLAIAQAEQIGADLIIGTDPDCDRMGAVVKNAQGEFVVLSGNQSGALMIYYLLGSLQKRGELPKNGVIIKTIVTSEMGAVIARDFDMEVLNTLTGFKYIGELLTNFAVSGDRQFLFGYEESFGYLAGTYARDKDAVVASMLISEAAAFYKSQGKTLFDVLQQLYRKYGYFMEGLESRTLKGKDGVAKIAAIMENWRQNPPMEVNGVEVKQTLDYSQGIDGLPPADALKYVLDDASWFCLRPSGTEPKIKVYFAVSGNSAEEAANRMDGLAKAVMSKVDQ